VFLDIDSLGSGKFPEIIPAEIEARAHFIVLLAPRSLDRCSEPGDWLRREIELALELKRNVIPVLVYGFRFENAEERLTGKLAELKNFNGLPRTESIMRAAIKKLVKDFLKRPVDVPTKPIPPEQAKEAELIIQKTERARTHERRIGPEASCFAPSKQEAGDLRGRSRTTSKLSSSTEWLKPIAIGALPALRKAICRRRSRLHSI
jgi:hypothetical protein